MAQSAQTLFPCTPALGLISRALLLSAALFCTLAAPAQEYQPPITNSSASNTVTTNSAPTANSMPVASSSPSYSTLITYGPAPASKSKSSSNPAPSAPAASTVSSAPAPELASAPTTTASLMVPDSVPSPSIRSVRQFFEPTPETEYRLYDGDEVKIDVAGHNELSSTQIIGPDGRVTVPLAGSILIAGMKREDASLAITNVLARYYHAPYVTVGVTRYSSYRVIVLGNVQHPGEMMFDRPPTLLATLARAGVGSVSNGGNLVGPEAVATFNGNAVSGIAGLQAWRCLIYRGDNSMAWVDIRGLLSGEAFGDMRLHRDDVVLIPVDTKFVSVLGAVTHPGPQHLMPQVTLQEVIAVAGGLAPAAGNNPLITIVDPATRKSTTVRFLSMMTPNGVNSVQLRAGDVIYVPNSKISQFGYVLEQLNPITNVLTFSALGAEYF